MDQTLQFSNFGLANLGSSMDSSELGAASSLGEEATLKRELDGDGTQNLFRFCNDTEPNSVPTGRYDGQQYTLSC